jgi:hypothetical protein
LAAIVTGSVVVVAMEEAEEVWKDAASKFFNSPPVGSTRCCCVPVGRFKGMTSPNCGDVTVVVVVVIVVVMVVDGSIVVDEDEASDIWLRLLSGLLLLFIVT